MDKQKSTVNKKVALLIAVILIFIVSIIVIITTVSTLKTSNLAFLQYRFFIMDTDSHPNIAKRGDLVIANRHKYGEVQVGDGIVYKDSKVYYCNEIVETLRLNTVTKLITAEEDGIKYQFTEDDISGKVIKVVPGVGNTISFLRTPVGLILFIIFFVLFFILLRFIWIGKKPKVDEEDNKQDNNKNM